MRLDSRGIVGHTRRAMRSRATMLILLLGLAGWASLLAPVAARAAAPTVTLTGPANGALITGGQPVFTGTAGDRPSASGTVTVDVYSGSTTSAVPVQVLSTTVTNGDYDVTGNGLADGTYTARASEGDSAGQVGHSGAVTFSIFNGTPTLTLTAPPAPVRTSVPTFTGTAMVAPGDSQTVDLVVYPGSSTDATPLALISGTVAADGDFSIQVTPGLADGSYTAVATQELPTGATYSPSVAFTVASATPALAVTTPLAGGYEPPTAATFSGSAGDAYGDGATIALTLYRGTKAEGTPVGHASATRQGASWSEQWPTKLALGSYTLVASQMNLVGQATTVTRSFTVATSGAVPGAVAISATGLLRVKLTCLAGAGTCEGDVLVLTASTFAPRYGGPSGPLSLMFAHYSVAGGASELLTAHLSGPDLAALRRAGATKLKLTVASSVGAKLVESSHLTAAVKVG